MSGWQKRTRWNNTAGSKVASPRDSPLPGWQEVWRVWPATRSPLWAERELTWVGGLSLSHMPTQRLSYCWASDHWGRLSGYKTYKTLRRTTTPEAHPRSHHLRTCWPRWLRTVSIAYKFTLSSKLELLVLPTERLWLRSLEWGQKSVVVKSSESDSDAADLGPTGWKSLLPSKQPIHYLQDLGLTCRRGKKGERKSWARKESKCVH